MESRHTAARFDPTLIATVPESHRVLFENLESILDAMAGLASQRVLWKPPSDVRGLFNHYLDLAMALHASKFAELCGMLVDAVNRRAFLVYGLVGRSLIEHAAVMRYYLKQRIIPTVSAASSRGEVTVEELRLLIHELDAFLRGSRFNWDAFLTGEFDRLQTTPDGDSTPSAINVTTCIKKWSHDAPQLGVLYDLFCDLVHPNIGSSLLVMNLWEDGVGFGGDSPTRMGMDLVVRTLAGLVGLFREIQNVLKSLLLLHLPDSVSETDCKSD